MRWFLSLIFVIVTLSSASATETKTEFITEEVCHAVAGCWINPKTGECPECVMATRKIVTVIEKSERSFRDFSKNKEKEENVMVANISTNNNEERECIVGVCAWLYEKD